VPRVLHLRLVHRALNRRGECANSPPASAVCSGVDLIYYYYALYRLYKR
jgi:hypothetical protein